MPTKYLQKLRAAITRLHGCEAAHVMTIPVTEKRDGKIIWEGDVELFNLRGHSDAIACYAWSFMDDSRVEQFSAILKLPPVVSAETAVRAAMERRAKNAK